jgi:hypothetical protein
MPKYSKTFSLPGVSAEVSFTKILKEAETWKTSLESMLGAVEIASEQAKKELSFSSKWVKASLICKEDAVQVDAELSMFAMPFKSKVDEGIERWIKKSFPETKNPNKTS